MMGFGFGLRFSQHQRSGPEIVLNGGFTTDSDWTKGTGWTISGGVAVHSEAAGAGRLTQLIDNLVIGKTYTMTVEMDTSSDASLANTAVSFRSAANTFDFANATSGGGDILPSQVQSVTVTWTATVTSALVHVFTVDNVAVDNISVREN